MQVELGVGYFDSRFAEDAVNLGVQVMDHLQAVVQGWQERPQREVQRVVAETFKCRHWRRIIKDQGVRLATFRSRDHAWCVSEP